MDKKTYIIIIVVLLLLSTVVYFLGVSPYSFKLHVLNVGKSDCSYIKYKDKVIMIDTGDEESFNKIDESLELNRIDKIDYLIITHFDKDHVGSASKLIEKYNIDKIYQTNLPKDNDVYNKYLDVINKKNILPITVENDVYLDIDKLKIVINGPDKIYQEDAYNNSSLIVSINYKSKSFLFMGDAMNERMEDYMSSHSGKYDVIKLPHHGDYLKQDLFLIQKYGTKKVIVSSDDMDKKLEQFISDKKLTLYYTKDTTEHLFKDF